MRLDRVERIDLEQAKMRAFLLDARQESEQDGDALPSALALENAYEIMPPFIDWALSEYGEGALFGATVDDLGRPSIVAQGGVCRLTWIVDRDGQDGTAIRCLEEGVSSARIDVGAIAKAWAATPKGVD